MIQVIYKMPTATIDMTDAIESLVWSGTISESVRQLYLNYIHSQEKEIQLEIGHEVFVFYGSQRLFSGKLYAVDECKEEGKFQLVFMDLATVLNTQPMTMKLRNVTAETVLREMCNQLGLTLGDVAPSKMLNKLTCVEKTGKQVIESIYDFNPIAPYPAIYTLIYDDKLNIYVTGERQTALKIVEGNNLIGARYHKNAHKVINRVKVISSNGSSRSIVENKESMALYGTFSHTLVTDSSDYMNQAKLLLNKPLESLNIIATGDIHFISGFKTTVVDKDQSFEKDYIILADRHEFTPAGYKVYLELRERGVTDNG